MGLIYVNPEGPPEGKPDPVAAAYDIQETFARMAMNDEETAALIIGGHTFGKTHGAGGRGPGRSRARGCTDRAAGPGWKSSYGSGKAEDAITSGLEVVWTNTPTQWDNSFLEILYGYEWELQKSPPAGAWQYVAKDGAGAGTIPDPFGGPGRAPTMLVTDVSMRESPIYADITRRWLDHPPRSWRRPSPRPGTNCSTATSVRSAATSARGFPSRRSGRTPPCPPSTTS